MKKLKWLTFILILAFITIAIFRGYVELKSMRNIKKEIEDLNAMKSPLLLNLIEAKSHKSIWLQRTRLNPKKRWRMIEVTYPLSGASAGFVTKKDLDETNFIGVNVTKSRYEERKARHHLIMAYSGFPGTSRNEAIRYIKMEKPNAIKNQADEIPKEILMNHLETIWLDKLEPALKDEARTDLAFFRIFTNIVIVFLGCLILTNVILIKSKTSRSKRASYN